MARHIALDHQPDWVTVENGHDKEIGRRCRQCDCVQGVCECIQCQCVYYGETDSRFCCAKCRTDWKKLHG